MIIVATADVWIAEQPAQALIVMWWLIDVFKHYDK
jgi:hypothetical protein